MRARFNALPLVVGLTGHRDLPAGAEAPLRERFGAVLDELGARHPSLPFLALSGLAAGADIAAAEVCIDRGIPVLGVLPMPTDAYEGDFSPQERERFRRTLDRCWVSIVVGTSRETGYADVGKFIAYYSAVLVAFWDGLPGRGAGGTADVIELRRNGLAIAARDALHASIPDVGPVIQIVTPRQGEAAPESVFAVRELYPRETDRSVQAGTTKTAPGKDDFERALDRLERFNRDIALERALADAEPLTSLLDRVDASANSIQNRTLGSVRRMYVAVALAGAAQLVLPSDGSLHVPAWAGVVARIGFLVIAFAVFFDAKRNDLENRYQDYRAIAEALRVQEAWLRAGLRGRLVEAAYLQMQQSELEWIRLALRTAFLVTTVAAPEPGNPPSITASSEWIDGQIRYYEAVGKREQANMGRAHKAMVWSAAGGAVVSAAAAAAGWAFGHSWAYWTTMPIALGGMIALIIRFYVQQRGFGENARRYQHMFTVFDAARRRLREPGADARKVLEQLGHEALSEHAEWLILHRDRPLTFVHT